MGINYYFKHNICESCGRLDIYHIGKSGGDCGFIFKSNEKLNLKTYNDYYNFLENKTISNDSNSVEFSRDKFFNLINKFHNKNMKDFNEFQDGDFFNEGYLFVKNEFS